MSEYKPFLEVVAEMQEGDIADSDLGWQHSIIRKDRRIYFYDKEKPLTLYFDTDLFLRKYKIRPRYVGWDEAEKAIREGKTVEWHLLNSVVTLCIFTRFDFLAKKVGADLNIMFNGKFIIQEDK